MGTFQQKTILIIRGASGTGIFGWNGGKVLGNYHIMYLFKGRTP